MNDSNKYRELVARINKFSQDRDWSKFHDPKNLALSLQLEASEVLELFQWTTDNNIREDKENEVSDELADVFYWLIMLANHYNIDLIAALNKKMVKNEKKYPIDKVKGTSKKYTEI